MNQTHCIAAGQVLEPDAAIEASPKTLVYTINE